MSGDNESYAAITSAIRGWDFSRITPYHCWGLPYLAAVVSLITGASSYAGVLAVSVAASFGAVALIHRLLGGVVAVWFAVLSWDWIQRSLLGGAEPLFVLMLLAA